MMRDEEVRTGAQTVSVGQDAPGRSTEPERSAAGRGFARGEEPLIRIETALVAAWAALYPVAGIVRLFMLGGGSVGFLPGACAAALALMIVLAVSARFSDTIHQATISLARAASSPWVSAACAAASCIAIGGLLAAPNIPTAFACYAASLLLATPICVQAALAARADSCRLMVATGSGALAASCFAILFSMQLSDILGSARNMSLRTGSLLVLLAIIMAAVAGIALGGGLRELMRAADGRKTKRGGKQEPKQQDSSEHSADANPIPCIARANEPQSITSPTIESVLNAVTLLGAATAFVCGFFLSVFWANVLDAAGVLAACLALGAALSAILGALQSRVKRIARARAAQTARRLGMFALLAPCILASAFSIVGVIGFALGAGAGSFWCIGLLLAANSLLAIELLCVPIKSLEAAACAGRAIMSYAAFETMLVAGVLVRRVIGLDATHVVASAIGALTMLVVVFALIMAMALRKLLKVSEQTAAARQSAAAAASAADAAARQAIAVQQAADEQERKRLEAEATSSNEKLHDARRTLAQARREFLEQFDLTERELSIALDFLDGKTMAATADHLGISVNTVRYNMSKIYTKANVRSKGELKAKAEAELADENR